MPTNKLDHVHDYMTFQRAAATMHEIPRLIGGTDWCKVANSDGSGKAREDVKGVTVGKSHTVANRV